MVVDTFVSISIYIFLLVGPAGLVTCNSEVTGRTIRTTTIHSFLTIATLEPPSILGPVLFSSRYPPIQFVKAGEPSRDGGTKRKEQVRTKKSGSGTGSGAGSWTSSGMPQFKFNNYGKAYIPGLGNKNWGLCDKDCGWCGHCADGANF